MTGVFVAVLAVEVPWRYSVGFVLFAVAAFTDYLDGAIARKRGLVTTFGMLMDPLADKVLMGAAFVMLADARVIPAWAVVLILAREFLVTGLRLVACSNGSVLAADSLGKAKTVLQIVTVVYFLLLLASREPALTFLEPLFAGPPLNPAWFGAAALALTLAATVVSGLGYLWRNRSLLAAAH
jgi:CDP-diacylglycerol--glycerol-3-phosphate 3-phosphatidyltransferase